MAAPIVKGVDDRSIAVLPLVNYSPDPARQFVADSMTELLTASLAQDTRLKVVSRTSATTFKGQSLPLPQIARALGVRYVIEGSTVESGGDLHIVVQLIDAERDEHV